MGHILRTLEARVVRGKDTLFTGKLSSLKRFKDDVREVKQGMECGIGIDGWEGIEAGDVIEFYEYETVRGTGVTSG
jgi:translation initiation factor IF-2